ncbi:MAG: hypothetical protein QOD56_377 [Gammaproteobacteria bacterium]|jgi:hypothetical protein|nr:hypothetical protein [Gammaproteobacteria bacterium]
MSRQRLALLVIAALVVISGALYLSGRRNRPRETQGALLVPALIPEMNSVTAVSVRKGSPAPSLTVHKLGQQWTVAQRSDYPADVAKLRKLLMALGDAKIIEEKTSDPSRYAGIGVDDPSQPAATGIELTVTVPGGQHVLIVGKPLGDGNFVRRAGEKQSYSVEPSISLETEPRFWIDSRLIDVPTAQIQSIEVKPAAGPAYSLHRLNPADNTFGLDRAPADRKALDAHALAPSATLLTTLNAEDVSPAADIDFSHSSQVIVTLTDGNIIDLTGVVIGDKHWLQVKSNKDPALSAKSEGRAFEMPSYRYDALFKPLEQLLVPKEQPQPKGSAHTPGRPQASVPQATSGRPVAPRPAVPPPAAPPTQAP